MATPKEIDKEQADRLHELLQIKQDIEQGSTKLLKLAITRAKATMTKEAIAWVEQKVAEMNNEG